MHLVLFLNLKKKKIGISNNFPSQNNLTFQKPKYLEQTMPKQIPEKDSNLFIFKLIPAFFKIEEFFFFWVLE